MHILFTIDYCSASLVGLSLLLSVHLGNDGSLLILDLLVNLGASAGLVSVLSSSISGLLGGLGLLSLLLLLLDSRCVGESVGNGSLVGLVESVMGVLGCSLVLLSGVGVTYRCKKVGGRWEVRRKGRWDRREGDMRDRGKDIVSHFSEGA